ncbi:hypothetical protein J6590_046805 [Homalodisca vitripennis]|nr:hypothetical protein J6590_046805 [Homalodisca vitripennis]
MLSEEGLIEGGCVIRQRAGIGGMCVRSMSKRAAGRCGRGTSGCPWCGAVRHLSASFQTSKYSSSTERTYLGTQRITKVLGRYFDRNHDRLLAGRKAGLGAVRNPGIRKRSS